MKDIFKLNKELWDYRKVIWSMGVANFKNEYVGSAFGGVWAILKPFVMVVVYSIVFSSQEMDGTSFVVWVIPGLFLWTFLSDSLLMGTAAIRNNKHLVQKVVFPVSILPAVEIVGKLLNHLVFMALALIIILISGHPITWNVLFVLYYMFSAVVLTIAITRLTSAMAVMSVDIIHFISTIMQLLFWATPVIWSPAAPRNSALAAIVPIAKLNPYFYLIEGYRTSLLTNEVYLFSNIQMTLYFWGITFVILYIGSKYYVKNRKEFADVM